MALKTIIQFPVFAPPNPPHNNRHYRPATEIRFSRWNNANAEKFIRHKRTQKEIEDELRFHKRFDSALNIANNYDTTTTTTTTTTDTFKSTGTPSTPSRPSIPGKKSKYSKNPKNYKTPNYVHPAFKPVTRHSVVSNVSEEDKTGVKISEKGVSYEFPEAPFEFQYSYTETPKTRDSGESHTTRVTLHGTSTNFNLHVEPETLMFRLSVDMNSGVFTSS
ncbi:unnamed protein product [Ilex paraguariensis]|uniref:Uncharacterized protein n=1 Tax=Ilex paraguariensis TaxID=185542 RepID=A0ABC8SD78_9AQUA